MDRTRKLNEITEMFRAANKLSGFMYNTKTRGTGEDIAPSRLNGLVEAVSLLNGFTPERQRVSLEQAVKRSYTYSAAYKNLKKHLDSRNENRLESEILLGSLKATRPAMGSRQVHVLDKIIQIYEILIN